jgi:hypothetical protein
MQCFWRRSRFLRLRRRSGFRPPRRTEGRVAFSLLEAPESLVYKIFFREFVGSQRAADQRREQGKDDAPLRTFFQQAFGLDGYEHQMLATEAQTCVNTQEANLRTTRQLTEELKVAPNNAAVRAQLAQLRAASEAAVLSGVQQLRLSLSPERFARLDLMIRVHVVPNLRTVSGTAREKAPAGGY